MQNRYPKEKNASEKIMDGFELVVFEVPDQISKCLVSIHDGIRAVTGAFSTINKGIGFFSNTFARHESVVCANVATQQESPLNNDKLIFKFKYDDILGYPKNIKEKIRDEIIQARTKEGFHRPIELQIETTEPQKLKEQRDNILKACTLSSFNRTNPVDITPIVLTASKTLSL